MTAPFGIEFHSPVDRLEILHDYGQGKFSVTPPTAHPTFQTYIVQATPGIGIFWIKGISAVLDNDSYGTLARQLRDTLHAQLSKRYGPGASTDDLMYGSIWNEPRDWAQSLTSNERSCYVMWQRPQASGLPDDLSSIFLGVSGLSSNETNICLEYASARMSEGELEIQDMLSDLL